MVICYIAGSKTEGKLPSCRTELRAIRLKIYHLHSLYWDILVESFGVEFSKVLIDWTLKTI